MAPRKNPRGVVIEMILPARIAGDTPRALRQLVIFDGTVLERATTKAAPTKHWRATHYGKGRIDALDVMNPSSWLGRWINDHSASTTCWTSTAPVSPGSFCPPSCALTV